MDKYIKKSFDLLDINIVNYHTIEQKKGYTVKTLIGISTVLLPTECNCGGKFHIHGSRYIILKHIGTASCLTKLKIKVQKCKCNKCSKVITQDIPMKAEGHNITKRYELDIEQSIVRGTMTNKAVSLVMHCDEKIVKEIDKRRLIRKYGDMKPTHFSTYIGVDEFSLHKNHIYATVVVDLITGEILYLERGKSSQQLINFFNHVGKEFMKHVKAISMDMNGTYSKAIEDCYPEIDIVYDKFHIVKNYNERVITEVRRSEQRRVLEQIDKARKNRDIEKVKLLKKEYNLFKGSRFTLLSNKATLEAKDKAAKEHNIWLNETYEKKGLAIPVGERKWPTDNVRKLETIIEYNTTLNTCYTLLEMLKLGLQSPNPIIMKEGLKKWIAIADEANIPELNSFTKMIKKRIKGIVAISKYNISNGKVEGTNNLIKTTRRMAYGYLDDQYFFLKLYDASRRDVQN